MDNSGSQTKLLNDAFQHHGIQIIAHNYYTGIPLYSGIDTYINFLKISARPAVLEILKVHIARIHNTPFSSLTFKSPV